MSVYIGAARLKDRLTIADLDRIYKSAASMSTGTIFKNWRHARDILAVVLETKPRIIDILRFDIIVSAAGLLNHQKITGPAQAKSDLARLIDYLSVRISKTQNEIATNCTGDELARLYAATLELRMEDELSAALIQHAPAELKKRHQQLQSVIRNSRQSLPDVEPEQKKGRVINFNAAFN